MEGFTFLLQQRFLLRFPACWKASALYHTSINNFIPCDKSNGIRNFRRLLYLPSSQADVAFLKQNVAATFRPSSKDLLHEEWSPKLFPPPKLVVETDTPRFLQRALFSLLKITHYNSIQVLCIPFALRGNDLLVKAEPGSGKTVAFLVPLIIKTSLHQHFLRTICKSSLLNHFCIPSESNRALRLITESDQASHFKDILVSNNPKACPHIANNQIILDSQVTTIPSFVNSKPPIHTGTLPKRSFPSNYSILSIILCPTENLVSQVGHQCQALLRYSPTALRCFSLLRMKSMDEELHRVQQNLPHILISTPSRFLRFLKTFEDMAECVKFCQLLVIDGADSMLQQNIFHKDLHAIRGFLPADHQTLMYDSALNEASKRVALRMLKLSAKYIDCDADSQRMNHFSRFNQNQEMELFSNGTMKPKVSENDDFVSSLAGFPIHTSSLHLAKSPSSLWGPQRSQEALQRLGITLKNAAPRIEFNGVSKQVNLSEKMIKISPIEQGVCDGLPSTSTHEEEPLEMNDVNSGFSNTRISLSHAQCYLSREKDTRAISEGSHESQISGFYHSNHVCSPSALENETNSFTNYKEMEMGRQSVSSSAQKVRENEASQDMVTLMSTQKSKEMDGVPGTEPQCLKFHRNGLNFYSLVEQVYMLYPPDRFLTVLYNAIQYEFDEDPSTAKVIVFFPTVRTLQFFYILFKHFLLDRRVFENQQTFCNTETQEYDGVNSNHSCKSYWLLKASASSQALNEINAQDAASHSKCRISSYSPHHLMALHRGLTANKRRGICEKFSRLKTGVLFASDLAAIGLDFSDVRCVIQLLHEEEVGAAENPEQYIKRMGRTGRMPVFMNIFTWDMPRNRHRGRNLLLLHDLEAHFLYELHKARIHIFEVTPSTASKLIMTPDSIQSVLETHTPTDYQHQRKPHFFDPGHASSSTFVSAKRDLRWFDNSFFYASCELMYRSLLGLYTQRAHRLKYKKWQVPSLLNDILLSSGLRDSPSVSKELSARLGILDAPGLSINYYAKTRTKLLSSLPSYPGYQSRRLQIDHEADKFESFLSASSPRKLPLPSFLMRH
ncbi:hypothetical protein IE077_004263 [Cardiosporidium cionae]|uniref:ATP-dependent RNA helicase n=1 Tax=Cardiosporidium cionae TaxID=476202 RepID=A0ABQ7JD03_9APIC|nr:hypothetical protein IE077_004263 [Cardiosporidium cionae]|eukprot:KAF8821861.1 hypothetical protein IE077_004263 [Cardiosporidium cionae]